MSGECDKCGEHCLDCACSSKKGWISVTQELPEVGNPVLLCQTYPNDTMFNCRADPLARTFISVGGLVWDGTFKSYYSQYTRDVLSHVTHWMLLPEEPGYPGNL
jgi:hypothetical protein